MLEALAPTLRPVQMMGCVNGLEDDAVAQPQFLDVDKGPGVSREVHDPEGVSQRRHIARRVQDLQHTRKARHARDIQHIGQRTCSHLEAESTRPCLEQIADQRQLGDFRSSAVTGRDDTGVGLPVEQALVAQRGAGAEEVQRVAALPGDGAVVGEVGA